MEETRDKSMAERWVWTQLNISPELSEGGGAYILERKHPEFLDKNDGLPLHNWTTW